eukprot:3860931-Rhodomonas_salina.2
MPVPIGPDARHELSLQTSQRDWLASCCFKSVDVSSCNCRSPLKRARRDFRARSCALDFA